MKPDNKKFKKIALLLIIVGTIGIAQAQAVLKLGEDPYIINEKAVLDLESTTKGFLPPRMTKAERDAITPTPIGLMVLCKDCNTSTEPASEELCVYLGSGWTSFSLRLTSNRLTTAKKDDTQNPPSRDDATSATINGTLVSVAAADLPTEFGVVYREISGTDFSTLPVLDVLGIAAPPNYKEVSHRTRPVAGDGISCSIDLRSRSGNTRPYYFRTYAKSPSGIAYGNPIILNCAPPTISTPVVTNGNTSSPVFAGKLTVNAGTPKGTVTEYGYCSSKTNNPPTIDNDVKVVLSTAATLADLDDKLNSETFTADPKVDLLVNNYAVSASGPTYFRYYVTANGDTTYSPVTTFYPLAAGSAVISKYDCTTGTGTLSAGITPVNVTQTIVATVDTVGTYNISTTTVNGVTFAGSGNLATGTQDIILTASGIPTEGKSSSRFVLNTTPNCSFTIPISKDPTSNGSAVVSSYNCTTVATTGTLIKSIKATGVTQTITANVSTRGTYNISVTANGVTFAGKGTFAGTGNQNILLIASGTPSAVETTNFVLNTTPSCTFSKDIKESGSKLVGGNAVCDGSAPTIIATFTSITGKTWMDRNLGASRAALSYDDYEAYGCLYQWGRGNDGHASITWTSPTAGVPVDNTTNHILSDTDSPGNSDFISLGRFSSFKDWRSPQNDNLWKGAGSGINNPCPSGYRIPTDEEFHDEVDAYNINNKVTAYASPHKFVTAGYRIGTYGGSVNPIGGEFISVGSESWLWTTTAIPDKPSEMYNRNFGMRTGRTTATARASGLSVRCIENPF